ncbi:hypothetical protein FUA23_06730 [Neolewinella aurantiaca]|uniref:Toxin-antitoxin system YwqK family antitoxin n=1 Tax=Neolewinella aurantiaca TaxID=2602767 RepID=A0A5C7FXG7_9BACT|nr:hypothetical protein [Neolewinella aurantiaca]TXF90209.1 hypothetical protein FUA23_06730 [Neolewinella aurantiaca]
MINKTISTLLFFCLFFSVLWSQDCYLDGNGLKQGDCVEEYGETFILRESRYVDGQLNGAYTIRYKYTNKPFIIEKGNYLKGRKHGLEYQYDTKGRLSRVSNYVNGILSGSVSRYVKGRLTIVEHYENGLAHGLWQTYRRDGTPDTYFYCEDEILGPIHYLGKNGDVEKIVQRKKRSK